MDIHELREEITNCTACSLAEAGRTQPVPGEGALPTDLFFCGEAPGEEEDRNGRPFVGKAGKLLNDMIEAMGFIRSHVYISNVAKCRPPDNRVPTDEEAYACRVFLDREIEFVSPSVLILLGSTAVKHVLEVEKPVSRTVGEWYLYQDIPVMPLYHPSYLLRNPTGKKREQWEAMKTVVGYLESI